MRNEMTVKTSSAYFCALIFVVMVTVVLTTQLITGISAVRYLGNEADWRENEDSVKRAMLILDPTQSATEDGYVTGWHVYTTRGRRSQKVYLQIWRPVKQIENRYMLVGETMITALWVGHNYFALYPRDRIAIRRGDVLGVYFPKYNPIPWTAVECRRGNQHLYKYNPYSVTSSMTSSGSSPDATGHNTNVEVVFIIGRSDWNPCRQYSVNATIMNEQELSHYDFDYQETTDGRYERRPYGPYLPQRASSTATSLHLPAHHKCFQFKGLLSSQLPSLAQLLQQQSFRHESNGYDQDKLRCLMVHQYIRDLAIGDQLGLWLPTTILTTLVTYELFMFF